MKDRRRALMASRLEILSQDLAEGIYAARTLRDAVEAFGVEVSLVMKDHPFDDGVFEGGLLATASACDEATTELLLIAQTPPVALPPKSD